MVPFYQIGEWFQDRAVDKSRASIAQLMDIRPDHANHVLADGSVEVVPPQSLKAGDILLVKPGERIPLDGIILEGTSTLSTSALTGESIPPGCCRGGYRAQRLRESDGGASPACHRRLRKLHSGADLRLVEDSGERKAKTERFITRFARWYTPAVCLAALLLALVPPLFVRGNGRNGLSGR